MPIQDVNADTVPGNDLVLVPVIDLDVAAERIAIAKCPNESWLLSGAHVDSLATPRQDTQRSVLRVKLPRVGCTLRIDRKPDIGLRSGHHPVQIARLFTGMQWPEPGKPRLTTVLNTAAAATL